MAVADGDPGPIRTGDLSLRRGPLYQLSYGAERGDFRMRDGGIPNTEAASMKIAGRQRHSAEKRAEIVQIAGDQVRHAIHAFPAPAHREQS